MDAQPHKDHDGVIIRGTLATVGAVRPTLTELSFSNHWKGDMPCFCHSVLFKFNFQIGQKQLPMNNGELWLQCKWLCFGPAPQARAIALTPGYDTVTVGGPGTTNSDDSGVGQGTSDPCNVGSAEEALLPEGYACPLQMERCQISAAAYELGDLARSLLQEACESGSKIEAVGHTVMCCFD